MLLQDSPFLCYTGACYTCYMCYTVKLFLKFYFRSDHLLVFMSWYFFFFKIQINLVRCDWVGLGCGVLHLLVHYNTLWLYSAVCLGIILLYLLSQVAQAKFWCCDYTLLCFYRCNMHSHNFEIKTLSILLCPFSQIYKLNITST